MPLQFEFYVIAALLLATTAKLYLALATLGSPDVLGYQDYLVKIRSLGRIGAYYVGGDTTTRLMFHRSTFQSLEPWVGWRI